VFEVWWTITEEIDMNKTQRKVLLVFMVLFLISVIYVPEIINGITLVYWTFLWNVIYPINFQVLLVEWVGLIVLGIGSLLYFKK